MPGFLIKISIFCYCRFRFFVNIILELLYMCKLKPNCAQRILYGHIIPKGFEDRYNQLYLGSILLFLMNNDEHSPDSNMAKSADNNDNQIENSNKGKIYLIETLEAVYIL